MRVTRKVFTNWTARQGFGTPVVPAPERVAKGQEGMVGKTNDPPDELVLT